ncbi:2,4'-dihydroxyacetophenone dioxygenase family protein [Actinomycetes bacterium KLBMP 9759]
MSDTTHPVSDVVARSADIPWVPQGSGGVWFKPLRISVAQNRWVNILKVTAGGVVNRHRHLAEVEGWVLQGRWHYIEHDWSAGPGDFVFEPPGDVHTLVADVADEEHPMLTLFSIHGSIEYVEENGALRYVETAETKLRRYLDHCAELGITGPDVAY